MNTAKKKDGALIRATIAAIIGNGIFGFSFMFSRMALNVTTPFVMLMYRFVGAFLVMNVLALWARRKGRTDWLRFSIRLGQCLPLLALGVIQPVAYFLCESYGISLTNATVSGVIIALIPIVGLAAGALFLNEKPTAAQIAFSLLSIAGVILMTLQQSAGGEIRFTGILLLIGAVITGAAFTIMSRGLSGRYSALERTYVMMLAAAVVFTGLALIQCRGNAAELLAPLKEPIFLSAMLYLSLLSSILAFLMLNYAATTLPVSKATAFCNLTTVLSVFAGVVFLGEPISLLSILAAAAIIVGVFGVQRG